jgi:axin 1
MTESNLDFLSLPLSSRSPPSCLKWARTLTTLLEDRDGVELFKKYVESEGGIHSDRLNFYFACEGLKQQSDPDRVKQIIGAIYRFLRKSQLHVPEDIKKTVKAGLKDEIILTSDLFDQMQQDVEKIINETTYPNFLQSELYLHYIRETQDKNRLVLESPQSSVDTSSASAAQASTTAAAATSSESSSKFLSRSSTLPTLHEEAELSNAIETQDFGSAHQSHCEPVRNVPITTGKLPMSLTKDALRVTQQRRLEMRPQG